MSGGADLTKDGGAIHPPMEQQPNDARLGIFRNEADFALGRDGIGDDGTRARYGIFGRIGCENGLNERLCHAEKPFLIRGGLQNRGIIAGQSGGGSQAGAGTAGTDGMIGHAGPDVRQARAHGGFIEAFAKVDDAVPRTGNFGIDDMRRCAVENEQAGVRHGHTVEAVWVAGTEIQGGGFAVRAKRRVDAPHEGGFADARPALENQLTPEKRIIDQMIEAGDETIRPHCAGEKGSGGIQKHPSH